MITKYNYNLLTSYKFKHKIIINKIRHLDDIIILIIKKIYYHKYYPFITKKYIWL